MREGKRPLAHWLTAYDPLGVRNAFSPPPSPESEEESEEIQLEESPPLEGKPAPRPRRSSLFAILLILVAIVGAGAGIFFYLQSSSQERKEGARAPVPSPRERGGEERVWLYFGPFPEPPSLPVAPPQGAEIQVVQETEARTGTIYMLSRPVLRAQGEMLIRTLEHENLPVTYEELPPDSLAIRSLPITEPAQKARFVKIVSDMGLSVREGEGELLIPRYYLWVGSLSRGLAQVFMSKLPQDWQSRASIKTKGPEP